jgi:hypothetical protein
MRVTKGLMAGEESLPSLCRTLHSPLAISHWLTWKDEVEQAMGIEPTRAAPPGLENKRFVAIADAKCD